MQSAELRSPCRAVAIFAEQIRHEAKFAWMPPKTNEYHKTINQPVILSGVRSTQSKFCGLSEANKQNRGANATKGYGLKFWWLFEVNVTFNR